MNGQDVQDFILSGGSNTAPSADTEDGFDANNNNNADVERGGRAREGGRVDSRQGMSEKQIGGNSAQCVNNIIYLSNLAQ